MCGIVGYGGVVDGMDAAVMSICLDSIAHRGPDASGIWSSANRHVVLGHRRLAIVDLSSSGNQPMVNSTGNLALVFNGEIYNHNELREELQAMGYSFRGRGDTEVLLSAYDAWGADCLHRLRGMFAFCIYDISRQMLFLARDRAGEKPLFWARHRSGFFFASELKALLADPSFPRAIDLRGLDAYLSLGYVPAAQSLVRGVEKVPPGHCLEYSLIDDTVRSRRYWRLPQAASTYESEDELLEQLHSLLRSSVREQLDADVPVSVLLSGGIDSSLVTALAANVSSHPIRTFSVGFPGHAQFDERQHARKIATHFGTDHTELLIDESSIDLLPALAKHYDEPIADSSMIPTFLLSNLVSKHSKVVLGGDGGDELFGGYNAYRGAVALYHWRKRLPPFVRSLLAHVAQSVLPMGFPNRNAMIGLSGTMEQAVARIGLMFDPAYRQSLAPCLQDLPHRDEAMQWKMGLVEQDRGVPAAFMASDFSSYLPEDILVKVDRASMASSLEVRSPFLDVRIVEFAFSQVPNHLRATKTERKILLKRLATMLLPKNFDTSRKQGFSIPLSQWLPLSERMRRCDEYAQTYGGPFDFDVLRPLMRSERPGSMARIFGVVLLMEWMQAYQINVS